uniref:TEP1-F n=1 Tax=Anopheles dirus TaxID=7168 RepID=A0A182NVA6_9DIPT
ILVVGPNIVQPNQQYKLTIINNNVESNTVNLKLLLEGSLNGVNVYNETVSVEVKRYKTKSAMFGIKYIPPSAIMKLTIEGINGFRFHEEVDLELRRETISGLIQFDKPVYKPDDMVQFRVIVLDTKLKPPVHVKFVHVSIFDSQKNLVKTWNAAQLLTGVYDGHFQIPSSPMLGIWNIDVKIENVQIVSKSFEVKEYVLLPVELQVVPSAIPLAKDHG